QRLLRYAASALLFTEKGVDPHSLFHGIGLNQEYILTFLDIYSIILPQGPWIGKISLCKALAQKLSIRFNSRFPQCQLIEVNAHSLLSKWFSENGKLKYQCFVVDEFPICYHFRGCKTFPKDSRNGKEESNLVFVLIDEVESLAAARKAAISGSDPSDSIQ
ncbi:hypothetical protein S83_032089, partial [Arachis hypogaea]